MADGFLGRWSKRKLDVQSGKPVEADPPAEAAVPNVARQSVPGPASQAGLPAAAPADAAPPAPPPTLEDVAELTPASDFSRFTAADVAPEVKSAAMKKLFSDPHFNVMDGLDIYIDDYGAPDPMPLTMLKSLASAQALGLFPEDVRQDTKVTAGPVKTSGPSHGHPESVAQLAPGAVAAPEPTPAATDADPDLRLQQDHAPGPEGPGDGAR